MRGRWVVLGSLILGSTLIGAPDLDTLDGPAPISSRNPERTPALTLPSPTSRASSEKSNFGLSIPKAPIEKAMAKDSELLPLDESSVSETSLEQKDVGGEAEGSLFGEGDEKIASSKEDLPLEKDDPENQLLDFRKDTPEKVEFEPMGQLAFLGMLCAFFGTAFLWIWYRKQIRGKILPNPRLPMQVLGQTWLDGQSKIMTLRVGSKILVIAKSAQYCTTLDVISDPAEVNLITLGEGQGDEDFQKVLKATESKSNLDEVSDAEGIQSDLKELKRQLGSLRGSK